MRPSNFEKCTSTGRKKSSQTNLQIQSEDEKICCEGKLPQATIDRWWEDGTFDAMIAEYTILRGSLQTIASELIGQSTQKSAGKNELHTMELWAGYGIAMSGGGNGSRLTKQSVERKKARSQRRAASR
jgi:hypothetical protein